MSIRITVILIFLFPTMVKSLSHGSGWYMANVGTGLNDSEVPFQSYDAMWDHTDYL